MEKLKIRKIEQLSENERGSTYELAGSRAEGYLLAYRRKGSVSGNHWHEGKVGGKDPERLLLLQGKIALYAKDLESGEEYEQQVTAPSEILIYPMLLHTLTALSDCSFLEFNSLDEHKADTVYPEPNPVKG